MLDKRLAAIGSIAERVEGEVLSVGPAPDDGKGEAGPGLPDPEVVAVHPAGWTAWVPEGAAIGDFGAEDSVLVGDVGGDDEKAACTGTTRMR